MKTKDLKKLAAEYVKLVEWSDEDNCYIGRCPELFFGGVHGPDEKKVYGELCLAVEDVIESRLRDNTLPKPKKAPAYSGRFVLRLSPELHKALAVRAISSGLSLNEVCLQKLSA